MMIDQATANRYLAKLMAVEGLSDFIGRVHPQLPPPEHVAPLIDLLERTRLWPVRAVISMPPRHAKTWTISNAIAWWMTLHPQMKHCYATYGQTLSKTVSRQIKRIATMAGVQIAKDQKSVDQWSTTDGGGLVATSVGGAVTGKGFNGLVVCDDLIKSRKEAESATIRDTAWEWLTQDIFSRLEGDASIIVNATRWHPDDPIGRIMNNFPDWEVINLPAIDDSGQALWPEVFPLAKLEEIKATQGTYGWASLYMGNPIPRGGAVFSEPTTYEAPVTQQDWDAFTQGKRVCIAIDPAASAKTSADYSVIMVMASKDNVFWVLDVIRLQTTVPELVRRALTIQRKWKAPLGVEAVGGFKAVPQMLRDIDRNLRVYSLKATTDKFTRAQPVAAAWADGRVLVPSNTPWSDAFLTEVMHFTGNNDPHDDQVDALAHAFTMCSRRPIVRRSIPWAGPFG